MRTELKGGGVEDLSQSETEGQGGGGMGPRCDEEWDTVAYTYLRDRA